MEKNIIDYEQTKEKLQDIVEKGIIKKEDNLAITKYGLPIEHFTVGEGDKDIVITGATHGSEIITTDFIIKLMESINPENKIWKDILKEFKIHFIPMLNPEGYLISTSAIRKLIPREMSQEDVQKICKQYYLSYREDDVNPKVEKRYQKMFENIDYTCIPEEYLDLREGIKNIFEKYPDLPKGCLQMWSSNGNGVDIQANSKYNPQIDSILANKKIYMKSKRFDNIDISHPGPINCPFDRDEGFKTEIETKAITELLNKLDEEGKLFLYLNYHSTGGMIYQRPSIPPEELHISHEEQEKKEKINYMLSQAYASRTYKNRGKDELGMDKRQKTRYLVQTGQMRATSTNDVFRIKYPQDLLIELSGMGGNPIAPYGDLEGNYTNTIESNLDATKFTLHVGSVLKGMCEEFYDRVKRMEGHDDYELMMWLEQRIFDEFYEKIMKLRNTQEEFGDAREKQCGTYDEVR